LQPLLQAKSGGLTLDVADAAKLDVRFTYADPAAAKEAEKAVRDGAEMLRELLKQGITSVEGQFNKGPMPPAAKHGPTDIPEHVAYLVALGAMRKYDGLLAKLPLEVNGPVVGLTLTSPPTTSLNFYTVSFLPAFAVGRMANATFSSAKNMNENTKERDDRLKKIVKAMDDYHAEHGHYPPAAVYGKDGQPLLSWRVLLLPYMGEKDLYAKFKLDEPWDSLGNKKLISQMPKWYRPSMMFRAQKGKAVDRLLTGPGTVFEGTKGVSKDEIPDGIDQTIFLVEVPNDDGVYWTKPLEYAYKADGPLPPIYGKYGNDATIVFGDGEVRSINRGTDEKMIRGLITRNGGEKVKRPDAPGQPMRPKD
jgi:hypothetical protein